MILAFGWALVRTSRAPYACAGTEDPVATRGMPADIDAIDEQVAAADAQLHRALREFLASYSAPDLSWRFEESLNNHKGLLDFTSSRNHRGEQPSAIALLRWLAANGPDSYGLVYLHDDEDAGQASRAHGRSGDDYRNEFRVWRLLGGKVDELPDPFLSPIVPRIDPDGWA